MKSNGTLCASFSRNRYDNQLKNAFECDVPHLKQPCTTRQAATIGCYRRSKSYRRRLGEETERPRQKWRNVPTAPESFTVSRSLLADVPSSLSLISVAATFRQNGAGKINQTATVDRPVGSIVRSVIMLITSCPVFIACFVVHTARRILGLGHTAAMISSGMHERRRAVRGFMQGSIGAEKRSDIIGGCRMSGSTENERRRRLST